MTLETDVRRGPGAAPGTSASLVAGRWPVALTWGSAVAALLAAGSALLFPERLRGAAVTDGNLRGTAAVIMLLGIPVLAAGVVLTRRGKPRGLVLWLGAVAYLAYQGVLFCFATPVNDFFLAYVAFLGLSLWATGSTLLGMRVEQAHTVVSPRMPYRRLGTFLGAIAVLNAVAWLGRILPATVGDHPQSLAAGSGLLTNPVLVQDLAFWIPAAAVVAALSWRRRPVVALLSGALLAYYTLEGLSVASDQWWGAREDSSHPAVASMAVVPGALVVALVTGAALTWHLAHVGEAYGRRTTSRG
jgi:hypothetical protein